MIEKNIVEFIDEKDIQDVKDKIIWFLIQEIKKFKNINEAIDLTEKALEKFKNSGSVSDVVAEIRYIVNTYTKKDS